MAGEPVRLALHSPNRITVTCRVFDYWNSLRREVSVVVPAQKPKELYLGRIPTGWYRLRIYSGGAVVRDDAFCVIRPCTEEGIHSRLFGVCAILENQDLADFLSFAGIRYVRRDWGWPTIEPDDDCWSPQYTRGIMERARLAGMQFLPILGYSPRFVRVKPADAADGRPAVAGHTWPISNEQQWVEFLRWCKEFAARLPTVGGAGRLEHTSLWPRLPAIRGWEVWNEVDQNFYYGPWHQYCDLLRLAYAVLDSLESPVIYGGSCGHWTEMGMALAWSMRPFFDYAAGHPGGEVDASMSGWYYGAWSIGYRYGQPFGLIFTESYFRSDTEEVPYPHYVLPMIAKLRHWGIEENYKGLGWEGTRGIDPEANQYCYFLDNGFAASPAYVATAFANWLTSGAAYAGRLVLGPGVEGYVFVRAGRPLLVLRSLRAPARVDIDAGSGAVVLDFLGSQIASLPPGRQSITVSQAPRVVLGCHWRYVAEAARARFDEYLKAQFWAAPETDRWSNYVLRLQDDLARYAQGDLDRARAVVSAALSALEKGPAAAAGPLLQAASSLRQLLKALAPTRPDHAEDGRRFNTLWRLCSALEWFSELAGCATVVASGGVSSESVASAAARAGSVAWSAACNPCTGMDRVRARTLARRSWETAFRAKASKNSLLAMAAGEEARVARSIAKFERPVLTRVVPFADFIDAPFVIKGHVLQPGSRHTLRISVCNETADDVAVTVSVRFPGGWHPASATRSGHVAAHSTATLGTVTFKLPVEGQWTLKSSWRPVGALQLFCPSNLEPNQQIEMWATVDGQETPHVFYFFNVGRTSFPSRTPQPAAGASL
ncbi:MAG: hypothetical protein H5T86_09725 [Armatimonadetes bacterium]|nr:hypothetical protein [Armatimonadota bacterium]